MGIQLSDGIQTEVPSLGTRRGLLLSVPCGFHSSLIWGWLGEFPQALPLAKPASQVKALAAGLWLNKDPLHLRPPLQDCLRACQEQIEALLESSLRQAQQNTDPKATEEEGEAEEEAGLACTPTDVRDVDI